jgi:hypothetical protein
MTPILHSIYRHPVKGLTPESLNAVTLERGRAIPNDRRFALALGSTPTETASTKWMPKSNFLMLQRNERLARLQTYFNDETDTLSVRQGEHTLASGKLTDRIERSAIENFFGTFMDEEARGQPKLVEAAFNHVLSDHAAPVISIINLSSLKDLERVTKTPVDPLRFRANIWLEGIPPWIEFEWINKKIFIESVCLTVTSRIDRCAAINVNPITAERDQNIIKALNRGYQHIDFGVFTQVETAGTIEVGDKLTTPD